MFSDQTVVSFEKFLTPVSEEKPGGGAYDDDQIFIILETCVGRIEDEIKKETGVSKELKDSIDQHLKTIESAFQKSSKSIRLVAFYMQLIFWKYQFNGLRDGLLLLKQLCDQHWKHLQPEDFEERYKQLRTITPFFYDDDMPLYVLNRIRLDIDGEFNVMDLIKSEQVANVDLETKYFKKIVVDDDNIKFFEDAIENFDIVLTTAKELDEFFLENLTADREATAEAMTGGGAEGEGGDDSESDEDRAARKSAFLNNTEINRGYYGIVDEDFIAKLSKIRKIVIDKVRGYDPNLMLEDVEEEEDLTAGQTGGGGGSAPGVIDTRATALQALERVIAYFKANEPHSPIPYALEEIKVWGTLPYPDLLKRMGENMRDNEDELKFISQRLGFGWPESEDSGY